MKLSIRDQIIAAVAVVVALALAAVFFLILPKFQQASTLDAEIAAADQEIRDAQTLLARRVEAKQGAARTSAELLRLANRMPEAPELPALIIQLQDTADASGLEFVRLSPAPSAEARSGYSAYKVNLTVSGRWSDFIDFERRLAKMSRAERTTNFSVTPRTSTESTQNVETLVDVAMEIEVYSLLPSVAASAAAVPPAAQ